MRKKGKRKQVAVSDETAEAKTLEQTSPLLRVFSSGSALMEHLAKFFTGKEAASLPCVCRDMKRGATAQRFLSSLALDPSKPTFSNSVLGTNLQRLQSVSRVSLRFRALGGSIGAIDDFLLEAACKHIAPEARSVRLHDASGTISDGAAQFLLRCPDLRELHVDGIWSDEIAVCLQQVLADGKWPNLTHLTLEAREKSWLERACSFCPGVLSAVLQKPVACRGLTHLAVDLYPLEPEDDVTWLPLLLTALGQGDLSGLQSLDLRLPNDPTTVLTQGITSANLPNLRRLRICEVHIAPADPVIAAAWSSALTTMLDALDTDKIQHLAVAARYFRLSTPRPASTSMTAALIAALEHKPFPALTSLDVDSNMSRPETDLLRRKFRTGAIRLPRLESLAVALVDGLNAAADLMSIAAGLKTTLRSFKVRHARCPDEKPAVEHDSQAIARLRRFGHLRVLHVPAWVYHQQLSSGR